MRVSVRQHDAGYISPDRARRMVIKLDGRELADVITADSDEGLVRQIARDASGRIRTCGDSVVELELKGNVQILERE